MKIRQFFRDVKYFFAFKRTIKNELGIANSKANLFGMKMNWFGNIVYVQVNCEDKDFIDANYEYDRMVTNKIGPMAIYLGQELGFSDYLVPQISNFIDENGNQTMSYGVMFIFRGYEFTIVKGILCLIFGLSLAWAAFQFLF